VVRARRLLAVGLPLVLTACGIGTRKSSSTGIALADYRDRIMGAECAPLVACGAYPDEATCAADRPFYGDWTQVIHDVNAGTVEYDAVAAAACVAFIEANLTCSADGSPGVVTPPSCNVTFIGTLVLGAACFENLACSSGYCNLANCAPGAACCAGSCAPSTTIPRGSDCSAGPVNCEPGSFCLMDPQGGSQTCAPQLAAGQPCTGYDQCASGYQCVSDPATGMQTCGPLPAEGEACTGSPFCGSLADYCDLTSGVCTRKVEPGGACPTLRECANDAACDSTTGMCVSKAAGRSCTVATECLRALLCVNGQCAAPPDAPACS
jgi:Dickkopf N-terminal cysteine-rich region